MTIRLIYPVADDPKGTVLEVDERRAQRLVRTGYADVVKIDATREEESHARPKSRHRV